MASNKTVLITGSSTGIGRASAIYFQERGWNVIATMRNPSKENELTKLENVICPVLDVLDASSIELAIEEGIQKFGQIDVVVNNAGYALNGPFEGATEDQIQRQFQTNVFGLMRVIKLILPHFRLNKSGVVVNVASVAGRTTFPFHSLYHGTKWAVEGFSESLRFELEPLGIRVKIVEPGVIKTDFYSRSNDNTLKSSPADYDELSKVAFKFMDHAGKGGSKAIVVAKVIFNAASDGTKKLRYPAGLDAKSLLMVKNFIPDSVYATVVRSLVFKK